MANSSHSRQLYVVDVATEADYEYVRALGSSVAANREIEGILNLVDGVYRNELLLRLRISFQNAWTTVNDPYTAEPFAKFAVEHDILLANMMFRS